MNDEFEGRTFRECAEIIVGNPKDKEWTDKQIEALVEQHTRKLNEARIDEIRRTRPYLTYPGMVYYGERMNYEKFKILTIEADEVITKAKDLQAVSDDFADGFHKAMWEAREIIIKLKAESEEVIFE